MSHLRAYLEILINRQTSFKRRRPRQKEGVRGSQNTTKRQYGRKVEPAQIHHQLERHSQEIRARRKCLRIVFRSTKNMVRSFDPRRRREQARGGDSLDRLQQARQIREENQHNYPAAN